MNNYCELFELDLPYQKLKNTNFLVTGGNGLIASNLIDALAFLNQRFMLNLNLYVLCRSENKAQSRFKDYLNEKWFHLIIQDVSIPMKLDVDFNYIFHAASSAHPQAFNTVPVDVMKSNFLGTLNLLYYSLNCTNTRFMFVSSSEVYGENVGGG